MLMDTWMYMLRTMKASTPEAKALFQEQFPRWHILSNLLMRDVQSQQTWRRAPRAQDYPLAQANWQFFYMVASAI